MKTIFLLLKCAVVCLLIMFTGCSTELDKKETLKPTFTNKTLNHKINPGDDFYRFVNTQWLKSNLIPDDKSRFGWFDILLENNRNNVKTLFADAINTQNETGSVAQKIGDFYNSGMDTLAIEKEGLQQVSQLLNKIDKIKSTSDLASTIGYLQTYNISPFFYLYVTADEKNSKMNIAGIQQGGLGLPDRDYYLENDKTSIEIRKAYINYLHKILSFAGEDEAKAEEYANIVMKFESKLAYISYSRLQNRDPHLTYNKINSDQLSTQYPDFKWDNYFKGLGILKPHEININQTAYFKQVGKLIATEDIATLKSYLKTLTIRSLSPYLSSQFVNAHFELYGKVIQGKKIMEPRWKRIQGIVGDALGEAVGQLFVQKYFPPEAKKRMEGLVENLRVGFGQRIDQLEWMSAPTKKAAKEKLDAIQVKIGYPNKWRDYSPLKIAQGSYVVNILAANKFDFSIETSKIGQPVDSQEWHMFPQTVNAYYNPTGNEIVFPAAILQPPFFYLDGDDAANYGAIGVVIGHEMTHGFDDQGAKYDKNGNLNTWWTEQDSINFSNRTKILAEQFNQFKVNDNVNANGELTLGEIIADLGGLNISYTAYQNIIKGKNKIKPIDGLNHEQRFLISYANIWA